jgi:hypothetical protein
MVHRCTKDLRILAHLLALGSLQLDQEILYFSPYPINREINRRLVDEVIRLTSTITYSHGNQLESSTMCNAEECGDTRLVGTERPCDPESFAREITG